MTVVNLAFENVFLTALWREAAPDRQPPCLTPQDVAGKDWTGKGFYTYLVARPELAVDGHAGKSPLGFSCPAYSRDGQIVDVLFWLRGGIVAHIEAYTFVGELLPDDVPLRIATTADWENWENWEAKFRGH